MFKKFKIKKQHIQLFANVIGDHNPVHTDDNFAAKTRFKSPIAHGMTSLCMMNEILPKNKIIKDFKITFFKPIYPQNELTAELLIKDISQLQFQFQVYKQNTKITIIQGHLQYKK